MKVSLICGAISVGKRSFTVYLTVISRNDMALGKLYTLCKLSPSVITFIRQSILHAFDESKNIFTFGGPLSDSYQVSLGEDSCNLIPWAFLHQEFEEKPWERRWESWAKFKEFLYFFFSWTAPFLLRGSFWTSIFSR